ncbi:hypothetical protein OIV83_005498 [Microbotryomycetes sp. JL201]|nr:hypothetical protein OIV83_005498 [Microbotryomycetes sp. JL201]
MPRYSDHERYDDLKRAPDSDDDDSHIRLPLPARQSQARRNSLSSDASTDSEDHALEQELFDLEKPPKSRVMRALGKRDSQRYSRLDSASTSVRATDSRYRENPNGATMYDLENASTRRPLPLPGFLQRSSQPSSPATKSAPRRTALYVGIGASLVVIIGLVAIVVVVLNNHRVGEQLSKEVGDALQRGQALPTDGHQSGLSHPGFAPPPSIQTLASPTASPSDLSSNINEDDDFDWSWNPVDWFKDDDEDMFLSAHPTASKQTMTRMQTQTELIAIEAGGASSPATSATITLHKLISLPGQDNGHWEATQTLSTTSTTQAILPAHTQQANNAVNYLSVPFRMSLATEAFQTFKGRSHVYSASGHLTPCGAVTTDQDFVAAIPLPVFVGTGQSGTYATCNSTVLVSNLQTGATVQVWVTGACTKCDPNSIELSRTAFKALTLSSDDLAHLHDISLADTDADPLDIVWGLVPLNTSPSLKDMQSIKGAPAGSEEHSWSNWLKDD